MLPPAFLLRNGLYVNYHGYGYRPDQYMKVASHSLAQLVYI